MQQCPICYNELEVRDCTPCDDCGWAPEELEHLRQGQHIYRVYEVYKGLKLTLCDFCDVDFGSYYPDYFGFKGRKRIGYSDFELVWEIKNTQVAKDKFCSACQHKINFLNFLFEIRRTNGVF